MVTVAAGDLTPPYEQLRRQFAALIGSGALAPGERLPPLRQLAGDLGLAVGTVARAYRELEAAGLIRSRHGGGTRVADSPQTLSDHQRRQRLDEHATAFVQQARLLDADYDAIIEAVRQALTAHQT
ncbi:MAG: GntR family transcriptional regulator [Umezawaea sp.]